MKLSHHTNKNSFIFNLIIFPKRTLYFIDLRKIKGIRNNMKVRMPDKILGFIITNCNNSIGIFHDLIYHIFLNYSKAIFWNHFSNMCNNFYIGMFLNKFMNMRKNTAVNM